MALVTPSGFSVEGAWTKAGVGSCILIKCPNKKVEILFDCGVFNDDIISANYIFISHGHTDHIGACVAHARARSLRFPPAKYYIPHEITVPLENARAAFSAMDGSNIPMEVIPVAPGDIVNCDNHIDVIVFETFHRVSSQGYAIKYKNKRTLKQEYIGMASDEIQTLVTQGVLIHSEIESTLEIVYTGDTDFRTFLHRNNNFILSTYILITELTYLDGSNKKAIEHTHIHINDIINNQYIFDNIPILFFVHISPRYSPFSKIINLVKQKLPEELLKKSYLSLKSFGTKEYVTDLSSTRYNNANRNVGWGWASRK